MDCTSILLVYLVTGSLVVPETICPPFQAIGRTCLVFFFFLFGTCLGFFCLGLGFGYDCLFFSV